MQIDRIFTEYQERPMGIDEPLPRFSWELVSEENGAGQSAYRIRILEKRTGNTVWDSQKTETDRTSGIVYGGTELGVCTRYEILLQVWDRAGKAAEARSWFETGLMNPKEDAWEGAQWIAAPRYTVAAETRGVFQVEAAFRLAEGADRAGIVFGEGDYRLLDRSLNEYGLEGENYIRYEVDVRNMDAPLLQIYRVGYAKEDTAEIPFAAVELRDCATGMWLLTKENVGEFHTLYVQVTGNAAQAFFDGKLVDAGDPIAERYMGRALNPRGLNDVLTYPRLNRIGFFAGETGKVYFKNYTVSNIRTPGAVFIDERPEGSLYGKNSVFAEKLSVEQGCFVLAGEQVTADPSNTAIPMLRRTFRVSSEIRDARLYITSRGIYDVQVNGKKITGSLLAPGLTQYDRRMNYQVYDITDDIRCGENGIGVMLSSGWWSDAQTFTVKNYNYFGDKEALLCKIVVECENGEREVIVSDTENWQYYGEGPYRYAGFFHGEHFDAEKEWIYRTFSCADFDASDWERPVTYSPVYIAAYNAGFARDWPEVNRTQPELVGGYDAPVYIVEERTAAECRKQSDRVSVYDFGQEMAGVPEIVFHEKKGTRIRIRYAEMLYPDLPRYEGNIGKIMKENYRDAESTDLYICRGDENGEVYRPRFTFHGFRYLELNGITVQPKLSEVKALQYSSVTEFDGSFRSSNPLLNRFAENVKWSQRCNFINIPTDCPQRNERMGWAGDTHVFCSTALHNSNLKLFYERNLQAMADLQEADGRYPEIAPVGCGFGGITYECATIFMAWELYLQYGDIRTLERFYPGMKKYMEYMEDKGLPGRGAEALIGPLADWLAFEETDPQLMWNAFYYREAALMEKIAKVLQLREDQTQYGMLRQKIKKFWNETFVNPADGRTRTMDGEVCDTQTSYALALEYGVADDCDQMAAHLVRKVRENDYKVGTGFFGTGLLNRALSRNGYVSDAYKMLLQTEFPSWLYPVTQGATTIWEHWDSYTEENGFGEYNAMNSFNHYSLGSVLSWMYDEILGVQRLENYPGFTHFELRPQISDLLDYARGSVATPRGRIESGWEKRGDICVYSCTIPVNTSAVLRLPDGSVRELGSGHHETEFPIGSAE